MPTIDGRTRLRQSIDRIANSRDEVNGRQGLGPKALFGMVVNGFPDLRVSIEGLPQLTDDESIYLTPDLLLVPDNLRLARGDRVVLLACQGDRGVRYLVLAKLRTTDTSPVDTNAKIGFNGDIVTVGGFVGVEVRVTGANEAADSAVAIYGDTIEITSYGGAAVVIDGINFKNHVHTDPQGGNSGPPH